MVITPRQSKWAQPLKNARPQTVNVQSNPPKLSDYDEYLKRGSRALSEHWTDTVEKIRERKVREHQLKEQQKKAEGMFLECIPAILMKIFSKLTVCFDLIPI